MANIVGGFERYVVICQNERQAKLVFEQIASYWDSTYRKKDKPKLRINRKSRAISSPFACVAVMSERKMFDFSQDMAPFRCRLINGLWVSRWLDIKEKEKENDRIES